MSAKGMPHCDTPASTDALPPFPSDAVTCRHSVVPNRARATQFAIALIAPVAAITAHDVAARASGDSIEFGGKEKSIGWNVAEEIGRAGETYSSIQFARVPLTDR